MSFYTFHYADPEIISHMVNNWEGKGLSSAMNDDTVHELLVDDRNQITLFGWACCNLIITIARTKDQSDVFSLVADERIDAFAPIKTL